MAVSTVITHGNRSLIASGTFITFDEGESRLELTVEDDRVEIIFNVINDGSDIRNNIIGQVELPDKFRVVIQNYRQVMKKKRDATLYLHNIVIAQISNETMR